MDLEYIKKRFTDTKEDLCYVEFIKQTKVIGIWDDHDIGCNNADKTFKKKEAVREIYLNFIDEPHDSPRRLDS
jgi:alkaline phosphatase D